MSSKTEQLEEIFHQIIDRFKNDRYVTVTPGEGASSEQYEVTYKVTGLIQKEDKSIQETKSHTIAITIPFGFPHFPPNCKPVTPIFHPDFDEAAICIGDFWTRDTNLPDLIIRIGRMISGEIYSPEDAFNEEAMIWYNENSDQLPFEIVNFSPPEDHIHETLTLEQDEEEPFEVDILDDTDFDSELDFLDMEELQFPEEVEKEPPEADSDLPNLDDLRTLLKQKRFQELDQIFKSYPKDVRFEGRAGFEKQIQNALTNAKKLQRQADELEHTGNPKNALEIFQQVGAIVTDYPNIQESIKRTRESLELLGDWTPGKNDKLLDDLIEAEIAEPAKNRKDKKLTFFAPKPKAKLRLVPIFISAAFIFLIAILIFPLFTEKAQLKKAQQALFNCQELLNNNKVTAAEKKCEEALELATGFQLLFKKQDKASLEANIRKVMVSPEMKQGLAGNILYEGNYIHKSAYETIVSYQKSKTEGDKLFAESKWKEAIASYKKALNIFPRIQDSNTYELVEINEQITLAEVNIFMENGIQFNETTNWKQGTASFQKALDAAQTLSAEKRMTIKQKITPQFTLAKFRQNKHQADIFFAEKDWSKALKHYQRSKELAKQLTLPDAKLLDSVNEKSVRAELYIVIKNGKDAFAKGNWEKAIDKYGTAINLLEENSSSLIQANTASSRKKLARVMLHAAIIRDQQAAAKKLKEKHYDKAITQLQSIDTIISKSEFGDQKEFQTILQETREAIGDVQSQKLFADLTSHLKDNYRVLFTQHFTSLKAEYIKDPIVTFIRMIDEKYLFKLQCVDFSQSRPSIYVMHYIYNPKSKKWQFYYIID